MLMQKEVREVVDINNTRKKLWTKNNKPQPQQQQNNNNQKHDVWACRLVEELGDGFKKKILSWISDMHSPMQVAVTRQAAAVT